MKQARPTTAPITLAAFVGIDWADQEHAVCLSAAGSERCESSRLPHKPEALQDWIAALRTRFGGRPVGVCLEQTRGALIHALLGYEFLVLFPINPIVAKRYRDALAPSGAKNDPVDAHLLWELLCKHQDHLRPWHPDDASTRQLALLCEHRRHLVNQGTRLVQQLTATLKAYYPQALDWTGAELASPMACDFLQRWPTLAAVQVAKPETLRRFYYGHRCRRADQLQARLTAIRQARPLTTDPAVVTAYALQAVTLARQLRPLLASVSAYDEAIGRLFAAHPDAVIFASFPGAGKCLAPRLLAAFGMDRGRFPDPQAIQKLSGTAPVTQQSGQSKHTYRRRACAKFLLQTFHEFARCSLPKCAWARAYYRAQCDAGKRHHMAIRALAFKWQRILWRCWQDRQPYDELRYLAALQRHGSPLAQLACTVPTACPSA